MVNDGVYLFTVSEEIRNKKMSRLLAQALWLKSNNAQSVTVLPATNYNGTMAND